LRKKEFFPVIKKQKKKPQKTEVKLGDIKREIDCYEFFLNP